MEEKTLQLKDCKLHYWVRTTESVKWIVFLHGAGCDHNMFQKQFDEMPKDYNLLVWDARGHGKSRLAPGISFNYKDMLIDFKKLMELHNMTYIVLIGQSMGGNLSQDLLALHQDRIKKVVLIDCTDNTQTLTTMEKVLVRYAVPMMKLTPWRILAKASGEASGETEYAKEYTTKSLLSMGKGPFLDVFFTLQQALIEDPSYKFPMPVLLLLGEKDKTGNIIKAMTNWPKKDKNAILKVIKGAGHNSNMDRPEIVNQHINEYLGSDLTSITREKVIV